MVDKEKISLISILFFLTLLQYLNIEQLWGIDFLLIGLFFYGYFINILWLISTTAVIVLLNLLISWQLQPTPALCYIFIPLLARRISFMFNINFSRYLVFFLCFLSIYIISFYLRSGVKNFFIIYFKNLFTACLIYLAFRQVAFKSLGGNLK